MKSTNIIIVLVLCLTMVILIFIATKISHDRAADRYYQHLLSKMESADSFRLERKYDQVIEEYDSAYNIIKTLKDKYKDRSEKYNLTQYINLIDSAKLEIKSDIKNRGLVRFERRYMTLAEKRKKRRLNRLIEEGENLIKQNKMGKAYNHFCKALKLYPKDERIVTLKERITPYVMKERVVITKTPYKPSSFGYGGDIYYKIKNNNEFDVKVRWVVFMEFIKRGNKHTLRRGKVTYLRPGQVCVEKVHTFPKDYLEFRVTSVDSFARKQGSSNYVEWGKPITVDSEHHYDGQKGQLRALQEALDILKDSR